MILIEAIFSHLLDCPCFLLHVIKKFAISKISTSRQSLRYNFTLNQNWRKINTPLCRTKIRLSLKQKNEYFKTSLLGVLKICRKFKREYPGQSLFSIKLLWNFIEIALRHECSPVNLLHIFRTPLTKNTSGWLLLDFDL